MLSASWVSLSLPRPVSRRRHQAERSAASSTQCLSYPDRSGAGLDRRDHPRRVDRSRRPLPHHRSHRGARNRSCQTCRISAIGRSRSSRHDEFATCPRRGAGFARANRRHRHRGRRAAPVTRQLRRDDLRLRSAAIAPATDLGKMLNSRAAGVTIIGGSGRIGAGPAINIRGRSTLSLSNQPLITSMACAS